MDTAAFLLMFIGPLTGSLVIAAGADKINARYRQRRAERAARIVAESDAHTV
ncbi:MAG: hypothetical protein ACTH0V_08875 [Microbacteriaceae bacterium]|uniref:hypothetical protein n=1 Tax=Microbacterium sp. JB110 TaxID=2024477 RepID=UPI001483A47E|nr:hypothetical protein [Microbacterium sp. JB110]